MKTNVACRLKYLVSGAVLMVAAGAAQAEMVYESTGFISNDEVGYVLDSFDITNSGYYEATLVDYEFPEAFDSLGLLINDGGGNELGKIFGEGSFEFYVEAGTYFAALYGDAADIFGLGLYGISIELASPVTPSAVPLPPALPLLGAAALVVAGMGRRYKTARGLGE